LLELANAYRGLANGGRWKPLRWTLDLQSSSITRAARAPRPDTRGAEGRQFMSPGAAVLVLDILQDPVARIPGFGEGTPLDLPFPAAAKTGTSRHFTDNWAVATTANFTVAVWVGNFSGRPMQGVSGISGAGPLLYRSALEVAKRYPPGRLPSPDQIGAEPVSICALSGLRATRECPSLIEWFLPGTAPQPFDDWQQNGTTRLPPEYAEWLASQNPAVRVTETRPGLASARDTINQAPRIVSPQHGDVFEVPPGIDPRYATIPLAASTSDVIWRVDGKRFNAARWTLAAGSHTILAEFPGGGRDSVRVHVRSR
jgi:penicillin-binding protein 1C